MTLNVHIRESAQEDIEGILDLYPKAFPDEDLVPLVQELLNDASSGLSLVGDMDGKIVAHVVFTQGSVDGFSERLSLLGPLCVSPEFHRGGMGTAIVKSGLARLDANAVSSVFVLGAPSYYSRFGFCKSSEVSAPYELPEEWHDAWQVLALNPSGPTITGRLEVTEPWQHEHLWLP